MKKWILLFIFFSLISCGGSSGQSTQGSQANSGSTGSVGVSSGAAYSKGGEHYRALHSVGGSPDVFKN